MTRDMEARVIPEVMKDILLCQGRYPEKFCVDILIRSVSGRGGREGGYLEDIEGS